MWEILLLSYSGRFSTNKELDCRQQYLAFSDLQSIHDASVSDQGEHYLAALITWLLADPCIIDDYSYDHLSLESLKVNEYKFLST